MEVKKTAKADLERDKSLNLLIGLVVAFAIIFVSFEYGEHEIEVATDFGIGNVPDEVEILSTRQDPPPPPEPQVIKTPEILEIIDDNTPLEDVDINTEDKPTMAQLPTYQAPVEEPVEEIDDDYVFVTVERMPEFPGGPEALLQWIADHVKYPPIAAENGIQGRVACNFVVNADGTIQDVQIVRSVDPNLDKEAIRVLKMLPKFKPGEQRGKPVRVKFSVPVRFKLQQ
ncbi:MAG: energy transducer TonB [Tannerella sp.]|nr:energy transducer TonB [Tannerella sp.]